MRKSELAKADEEFSYLFDGQPHLLAEPVREWLDSSRQFTAFVKSFREKIRKKLRVTQDENTLYDLRLELETAYLLLREKTLSVAYEPEHSKQVRSPDFAVTYTTSLTFMVEVTRLRAIQAEPALGSAPPATAETERLIDAICSKLGQFLPQRSNILIIGVDSQHFTQTELQSTLLRLQQRAERDHAAYWQRYGFRDRADFFNHYQRLSEVLLRGSRIGAGQSPVALINTQARYPLPSKVRTALYRSHTK